MKLARALLLPPAFLCVAAIRLLRHCGVLIRFGESWSGRIGHLAGNNEIYLCERDMGWHKGIDIWRHNAQGNKQLMAMFERVMTFDKTGFSRIVDLANRMFIGWERFTVAPQQLDRDIYNLMEKLPAHLKFTDVELARGRRERLRMGIPDGAKWVCLIVRDNAYLPDLTYHNHRDTEIDNYVPMALELAHRGYYVVRVGAKVNRLFETGTESHIIDYANSAFRNDFMDIYLGNHCEFCVSSGTGFDAVPVIFRRPVVFVNYVPLEYLNTWVPGLAIWRHHRKDGKRMTPKEIYASGAGHFMRADEYEQAGITLEENSPQEITDAVMEMVDGISTASQAAFWDDFPRSHSQFNQRPLHGQIRLRIGVKFLESYETDCTPGHQGREADQGRAV